MATHAPRIADSRAGHFSRLKLGLLFPPEKTRLALLCAAIVAAAVLLFWRQLVLISHFWFSDGTLSIGVFAPLVSAAFALRAWKNAADVEPRPATSGFLLALGVAFTVIAWNRAGFNGLTLSMVLIPLFLAGSMASVAGWRFVRCFTFPLAFLWFMLPLPPSLIGVLDQPLQLLCARVVESAAHLMHMPVVRSGTIVGPNLTVAVDVAPECNGVRSAITLLTLAVVIARLQRLRLPAGMALVVLAVGLAYVANLMRLCTLFLMMEIFRDSFMNYEHVFDLTSGGLWFLLAVLALMSLARRLPHRAAGAHS